MNRTPEEPVSERPPRISDAEEEVLAHPEERFPPDAPPERIDEEQLRQGRLVEKEKEWIDPEEIVGGEE
jgi:hypothetical protein